MDKTKYFAAAEKAVLKGQNEKALEALEIILKSDPQDLKALNRAADIHLKLSNNEKALDYLKRVGNVYTKDGFYSKAVAIYKRILKVDQAASKAALIEIHEKLADLYGQLGLVSDAMSHFSIVVDFYDQTGEQEALLRILKKVSDLDPFNIESQLKLASLFLAEKKPAEAIETLRRLDENILARGHMPDIVRVHERWVELFPQEIAQLQYLVDLYLKANEPKKALARIQISFKADPKNPEVLELLSSTFIAMKQPDKARAVDTELLKIYRQAGTAEKAFATEERLKNKAGVSSVTAAPSSAASSTASANPYTTGTATKKVNLNAGAAEEVIDSAEFLIRELQLDPEEKKVISECDVYLKYGLAEKAFEVLRNNLGKFPQSIALRWKLKIAANELDKSEDLKHILSEIVLLATTLKLDAWIKLSTDELIALDPQHPSVKGKGGAKTVASSAQAAAPKKAASPAPSKEKAEEVLKDFEASEISIIVEDELSLVSEVSDISIKDLQPEVKSDPSQEPTVKRKPEEMSAPVELNNDFESSSEEFSLDSGNSEASQVLELELNEVESDSSVEEEVNPETILSDADFTDDELQFLNSPMESEATVTAAAKPATAAAPAAPVEETMGIVADDDFEIRQGLEEVEFFKAQGLIDEAHALLKSLKEKFPQSAHWGGDAAAKAPAKSAANNDKVKQKKLEIETLGTKVKMTVQEDERDESDHDFYDLAQELDAELKEVSKSQSTPPAEVKDVFSAFKKGVAESVSADDFQTHFDLGIAYREMGLFDDAIEEFKLVGKVDGQKVSSLYQIGLSLAAKGEFKKAKESFDAALKEPNLVDQEKLSVTFELAEVLLKLEDPAKAKKLLQEVQKIDPEFREVADRIRQIG